MSASKHFDLNTDNTLGGENTSNVYIPSQKAVKEYVDNINNEIKDTYATKEDLADSGYASIIIRDWSDEEEEDLFIEPDMDGTLNFS